MTTFTSQGSEATDVRGWYFNSNILRSSITNLMVKRIVKIGPPLLKL